jgi:hypothetical protein
MPVKKIKKPLKKAAKKAKPKPRKNQPTIVNRNVINFKNDQTPSSGARIPITIRDVYDTTPRIERPQESTFALIENQSKQLALFKTDLLQHQQDNFNTLTESVAKNLALMNGDIQDQNTNTLALYNDGLQAQEEEEQQQQQQEQEKYFWDLKEKQKEQRLKNKENDKKITYSNMFPQQEDDKLIMHENKLTDAQKTKLNQYATSNVKGDINQYKKVVKETEQIFGKKPEPKETKQIYPKDSIFMNDDEPDANITKGIFGKSAAKNVCDTCGFVAKTPQGLAGHKRVHKNVSVEDVEDNDA